MTMTKEKKKPRKREHVAHPHVLGEKNKIEKVLYNQKVKLKCTVLSWWCDAPHHDTWRNFYCPDSSLARHPLHIHSQLSLSLSLYSISSLCFSSSSREEVVKDVEENKEEGEGVLRRDHAMASGAQLFIYFFLSTIYGVLFFLLWK
jgi:hypothetical protein